jgi:hypothetical protein
MSWNPPPELAVARDADRGSNRRPIMLRLLCHLLMTLLAIATVAAVILAGLEGPR